MSGENPQPDDSPSPPPGGRGRGLDHELEQALGEMHLDSLMDLDIHPGRLEPAAEGVRHGTVVDIQGSDIFLDLGGKDQGVLPVSQFEGKPLPEVGEIIEVVVESYNASEGLLMLSRQGAVTAATWQSLRDGQIVEGRVVGHNKGGLELDLNGIKAFMPISQIELSRVEELAPYVNQRLRCEVMEVRRSERSVVLSRRGLLRREEEELRQQTFETLEEGQIVKGVVKTIMPYGAFLDIGGVDGLLHIGDMSYSRVENTTDVVREGQTLEVKILEIDRDERKIGLGLKQIQPDPWAAAAGKWPVDEIVAGRITRLEGFGAFVELAPGVQGLVHISELSDQRVRMVTEVVREGDVVRAKVVSVDEDQRRIGLSIRQLAAMPDYTGAAADADSQEPPSPAKKRKKPLKGGLDAGKPKSLGGDLGELNLGS